MTMSRMAHTILVTSFAIAFALSDVPTRSSNTHAASPLTRASFAMAAATFETMNDDQFRAILRSEKAIIVLQLTSFDPNCRFCINANRVFEVLAAKHASRGRFIRVHYEPWSNVPATSIMAEYNVPGVPAFIVFHGGKERRRILGHRPESTLEGLLFDGSAR